MRKQRIQLPTYYKLIYDPEIQGLRCDQSFADIAASGKCLWFDGTQDDITPNDNIGGYTGKRLIQFRDGVYEIDSHGSSSSAGSRVELAAFPESCHQLPDHIAELTKV
jgi:hypothetical protein